MFLKRLTNRVLAPFQLFYWRLAMPHVEGSKVLIECNGKYFLMREVFGQKHWTLPGGRAKPGEDPEETARRKTKEEAGIVLDTLQSLGTYFHTRQGRKDVICAYYARVDSPLFNTNTSSVEEAGWFSSSEIANLHKSESVDDVLELYTKYRGDK